jgi:hypothetical protein
MRIQQIIVTVGVGACIGLLVYAHGRMYAGSRHEFEMNEPSSPFLTEDVALDSARKALIDDGFDLMVWAPVADGRSVAPDGEKDKFMARNGENPNRGYIQFQSRDTSNVVFVNVEKTASKVVCTIGRGK